MTGARAVTPTDVLSLASLGPRSLGNEAWTRERVGTGEASRPVSVALDQMLPFSRRRSAWVCMEHQRLQGMAGARRRGGNAAWEVDYLVDVSRQGDAALHLLEKAVADCGRNGAEKLFLRLKAGSPLLGPARQAGFYPYMEEVLLSCDRAPAGAVAWNLRSAVPSDSYPLFRLYNLVTPEAVRRSEAPTFGEWHDSQERHWLRNGVQLVLERDGRLLASVAAVRLPQGVSVDLLLSNDVREETLPLLRSAVLAVEASNQRVFVLHSKADVSVTQRLFEAGFQAEEEFVCLVRRTARPQAAITKAVPAVAKTVVGV